MHVHNRTTRQNLFQCGANESLILGSKHPIHIHLLLESYSQHVTHTHTCMPMHYSMAVGFMYVCMYVCITAWRIGGRGPRGKQKSHTRKDSNADNDRTTYTTDILSEASKGISECTRTGCDCTRAPGEWAWQNHALPTVICNRRKVKESRGREPSC